MLSRRHIWQSTLALAGLSACQAPQKSSKALSIAATAVPHAEILKAIVPDLKALGIELNIKIFNDYVQPNLQVDQGRIDCSYFETLPYLNAFNKDRGTHLSPVVGVHVEPFGGYSHRYKVIDDLPKGAVVALPNDPTTTGRALILLNKNGLIRLKDPKDTTSTPKDIIDNPKALVFKELEAPALPRVLDQVDLALINTNYALDAKLDPLKDALIIEGPDSPYLNYLVARSDRVSDPKIQTLAQVLTSAKVKDFIRTTYHGAVLPS